jgi:hypothetical protein
MGAGGGKLFENHGASGVGCEHTIFFAIGAGRFDLSAIFFVYVEFLSLTEPPALLI